MAVNLWRRWKDLTARDPLLVADVLAAENGMSLVEYPGGSRSWVTGTGETGRRAFIQGGKIISTAPTLALVVDTV